MATQNYKVNFYYSNYVTYFSNQMANLQGLVISILTFSLGYW